MLKGKRFIGLDEAWDAWCEHNANEVAKNVPVMNVEPPQNQVLKWIPTVEDFVKFRKWWLNVLAHKEPPKEEDPSKSLYTAIQEMLARLSYFYGKTDGTFEPPAIKEIYEIGDKALRYYEKRKKEKTDGSTENG